MLGYRFQDDLGDTVPVKYTLRGLTQNNHEVKCIQLDGSNVKQYSDISDISNSTHVRLGISDRRGFRLIEVRSGGCNVSWDSILCILRLFSFL